MRGFSLIEVVVSVAIIASTAALTAAMLRTTVLSRHLRNEDLAAKVAGNKVENLRGLGYSSLPVSGSFTDTRMSALPSGTGATSISDYNAKTKKIIVTVSWVEAGAATSTVELTTLVTQIGGLP